MVIPQAMQQRKRSRKESFSSEKKAEVQSFFRACAHDLGLVDIMFKLHDMAVADVP
jgi:hypothetical protein